MLLALADRRRAVADTLAALIADHQARFGLIDYIVGEKLLNFAAASAHSPDFARELPRFLSEVRRLFAPEEIAMQLADIERAQKEVIPEFGGGR